MLTVYNIGSYTGSATGNDIEITGGGAALTNSVGVYIHGMACNGALRLNRCSKGNIVGFAASKVVDAATVTQFDHSGVI